jgi:hypothetical protein
MNQQLPPTDPQQLPHVYTEEEQRLRWTLIVHALLTALGSETPQRRWMITSPSASQPEQRV